MPVLACQPVRRASAMSRCSRSSIATTLGVSRSAAGVHGSTRSRKRISLAQNVPTPHSTRWSSSTSPTNPGDAVTRAAATSASQSGPSTSGPRWPTRSDSRAVGTRSSMPSRRPTADHVSVSTAARTSGRRSARRCAHRGARRATAPPSAGACGGWSPCRTGGGGACRAPRPRRCASRRGRRPAPTASAARRARRRGRRGRRSAGRRCGGRCHPRAPDVTAGSAGRGASGGTRPPRGRSPRGGPSPAAAHRRPSPR